VLTSLASIVAARDWYPDISETGQVRNLLRFIDLDQPITSDCSALKDRVCLAIGITRNPTPTNQAIAQALDLTLTTTSVNDPAFVTVPDIDLAVAAMQSAVSIRSRSAMVLAATLRQTVQLPIAEAIAAEAAAYSTLLGGPEFGEWLSGRTTKKIPASIENNRVLTSITGDTLNVRMNRKLRLNAIDGLMRAALVEAFDIAIADTALHVQLSGEGPCFSNGGDLREFGSTPDVATAWTVRMTQHPGWRLSQIADRVSVHMHGKCIGAGVEMAAFASHVTADPETTFELPELAMGLIPGAGGCVSIPRRIGRWRTLWLVLTGTPIHVNEALAWGLIDDIHSVP
jgi:enoyl-CoA hydratase/carnithine racemase